MVNGDTFTEEPTLSTTEAKAVVGDRPVFDFAITGSKGEKVTEFGKGKITISLPYTLGENEKAENLVVYYIDHDGKVQEMPNCVYDEKTKTMSFVTVLGRLADADIEAYKDSRFKDVESDAGGRTSFWK